MPTYPYQCATCGELEYEQSISDPPLRHCPQCGGAITRLIGGGSASFVKGQAASHSHCERDAPCCGAETRCNQPPCGSLRS